MILNGPFMTQKWTLYDSKWTLYEPKWTLERKI